MNHSTRIQHEIESTLATRVPDVEVVLAERPSPGQLRVVIDRPGGVDLDLCERVTRELASLREQYALEVSSPGLDRPLVKPDHYRRAVGERVAVRTDQPLDGRRQFTGTLIDAGNDEIEIDLDGERTSLPYAAIRRGNLVAEVGGKR